MRYSILLLLFFVLVGCGGEDAGISTPLDIIEHNVDVMNKAKEDIRDIEDTVDDKNEEVQDLLNDADLPSENTEVLGVEDIIIPEKFDLEVPFGTQSPFAVWDDLHNEACEEAAMIMAVKYLKNEKLDKQIMEDEIQAMIKWEEENGYEVDLHASEAVEIFKDYFGLNAWVEREVTVESIKKELAIGNLIVSPHIGWELDNPYYKEASSYHYLVIKGWTRDEFITNDNGTRRGEGFKYSYDTILSSMHDFNEGDVENGERVMIVVGK